MNFMDMGRRVNKQEYVHLIVLEFIEFVELLEFQGQKLPPCSRHPVNIPSVSNQVYCDATSLHVKAIDGPPLPDS